MWLLSIVTQCQGFFSFQFDERDSINYFSDVFFYYFLILCFLHTFALSIPYHFQFTSNQLLYSRSRVVIQNIQSTNILCLKILFCFSLFGCITSFPKNYYSLHCISWVDFYDIQCTSSIGDIYWKAIRTLITILVCEKLLIEIWFECFITQIDCVSNIKIIYSNWIFFYTLLLISK